MSAYTDFCALVAHYRAENPAQRDGQAHFNLLHELHPEIADEIRSTPIDPFHVDAALPAFHTFVDALLGDS